MGRPWLKALRISSYSSLQDLRLRPFHTVSKCLQVMTMAMTSPLDWKETSE